VPGCWCSGWVLADSIIPEHTSVVVDGFWLICLRSVVLVLGFGARGLDKEVGLLENHFFGSQVWPES